MYSVYWLHAYSRSVVLIKYKTKLHGGHMHAAIYTSMLKAALTLVSVHLPRVILYMPGLKVGRMTWIIWVTFGGSSRSHPQTKLSGCDPDITLENSIGIW